MATSARAIALSRMAASRATAVASTVDAATSWIVVMWKVCTGSARCLAACLSHRNDVYRSAVMSMALGFITALACSSAYIDEQNSASDALGAGGSGGSTGAGATDGGGADDGTIDPCANIGNGPGLESCCAGKYCKGSCLHTSQGEFCDCDGIPECPSNSICCPGLGCASVETCQAFLDAGTNGG
jgi:hypothetical protein